MILRNSLFLLVSHFFSLSLSRALNFSILLLLLLSPPQTKAPGNTTGAFQYSDICFFCTQKNFLPLPSEIENIPQCHLVYFVSSFCDSCRIPSFRETRVVMETGLLHIIIFFSPFWVVESRISRYFDCMLTDLDYWEDGSFFLSLTKYHSN